MKTPCQHELKANEMFPTCKHCNEVWYDLVGYQRSIERDRKAKEARNEMSQVRAVLPPDH